MLELQVLLEGVCLPQRFLRLIRDFIVFEDDGSGALVKKMAGYHQYHAVRFAVEETLRAVQLQRRSTGPRAGEEEQGGGLPVRPECRAARPATAASASSGTPRALARV